MKYIARLYDYDELLRIRELLHSKGIPTYEMKIGGARSGGEAWALYVCLSEHLEDALQILRDPSHEPANPVDATAFEEAVLSQDTRLLTKLATIALLVALPLFAGVCYLVWRFG